MEIRPGIYKHYKGGNYLVLGVFCHTETLEKFVAYVGLSCFWIRPLESFISEISHPQKTKEEFDMKLKHYCHVPNCNAEIPPKLLMCKKHWTKVPDSLKLLVYINYRPGQEQETDKNPSPQYLEVAKAAIASVKDMT